MPIAQFGAFLSRCLLICAFILAAGSASSAVAQKYAPKEDEEWTTYKDARYGFRLFYPTAIFEPQDPEDEAASLTLLTEDGNGKIVVFAAENDDNLSPEEYRTTLLEEFGGYEELAYQPKGKTWFVLSGFRGDNIYYQKVMFSCRNQIVNVFSISFPTAEKPFYERLIEIMEDNFKSGRGSDTPSGC